MAKDKKQVNVVNKGGAGGGFYFLTFIGAAFYFVGKADGFGEVIVAILQAMVWPAFVIYHVLEILRV